MDSAFESIEEPNRRAILRVLREARFVEFTVDDQRRLSRQKPGPFREVEAWLAPFRELWSAHVDAGKATGLPAPLFRIQAIENARVAGGKMHAADPCWKRTG